MNIQQIRNEAFMRNDQVSAICMDADDNASATVGAGDLQAANVEWLMAWQGSVCTMLLESASNETIKFFADRGIRA